VCDAKKLEILAEFKVRPSQIGACHSNEVAEVAKTSYSTTIASKSLVWSWGRNRLLKGECWVA